MPERSAVSNDNPVPSLPFLSAKCIRIRPASAPEDAAALPQRVKQPYLGNVLPFGYPACPNLHNQDKIQGWLEERKPAH